jgi:murein DD-endopeptidase MepM/ murein hydrolase activator NlpD
VSPRPPEDSSRAMLVRPQAVRRGWLSHGLAALAISALGLGVAGSMPLTTSAETQRTGAPASQTVRAQPGQGQPGQQPAAPERAIPANGEVAEARTGEPGAAAPQAALVAFAAPQQAPGASDEDELVRAAVVKERAAQRAEELTRAAEDATRLTRTASKQVRDKNLAATDREIRETAVRIATERRQRAIAARVAAEFERKEAERVAAEAAAQADDPTATDPPPAPVEPNDVPVSSGGASPVPGAVVGSPFGATGLWARYHTGLDFRAGQGTPIRAVQSGVVLFAGNKGNWSGNHVAIQHPDGMTSMSSHMSSMAVISGESVQAGQVIGRVGQTGRAFGAHLHFEIYPRGVSYGDVYSAINPVPWLRDQGVQTR